jgi:microcystin degradation protein MlrC
LKQFSIMAAKIRFGVACITQESNTFAPFPSTLKDFWIEEGIGVVSSSQGTNTEVGGFLTELDDLRVEVVPLVSAWAVSAGPVEDSAFERLANRLIEKIEEVQFDGLLLALHGSWLSSSHPSADAELVKRVRKSIGPKIPIVITLDLHANVRPVLLEEIQGLVGFRTYPHVDMAQTGQKAARLLYEVVTHRLRPRLYWVSIPLLAPPQSATTDRTPVKDILERLDHELPSDIILCSSFFCVQPWLDMKEVSSSLVVVARSENAEVPATLRNIAGELWDRRSEFQVEWISPDNLVPQVLAEKSRPVIVSEAFDATTGGAPGDHPGLLSILLSHREQLSACVFMVDHEAADHAHQIGLGESFRGLLGAKRDKRFGSSLMVEARICHLSDGTFVSKGPVFTGRRVEMGPSAVLEIGRLKVVVASQPVPVIDPELYRSQQIEPGEQDIVAVKSPTLFRPGYASMLGRVLHLDMPGVCRGNLVEVPYANIGRPISPLDEFSWRGSEQPVLCFGRQD